MLNIWQFTKGYARIAASGFNLERFINMAAFHGVYIWNAERTAKGVEMNVSLRGCKMMEEYAQKTKTDMQVLTRRGLPVIMEKYKHRKALMGGAAVFLLGLVLLSSFVWEIQIHGNEEIPHETILTFLENEGLRPGAFKPRLSDRQMQSAILNNFPQVVWADVHTRGTRTRIQIVEAIAPQEIIDRQTPTHVIAATDGLITAIATASGAPLVRQNDVVQEGEMLVSGIMEVDPDMPGSPLAYVHAYAEVWARRYHKMEFSVPLTYEERVFTGETRRAHSVQLLFGQNRRINLPSSSILYDSYDKITTRWQPGAGGRYPLPFVIVTENYREFTPTPRTRTTEEARLLAERILTNRLIREFPYEVDIISREMGFSEDSGYLLVTALITTHERIDRQVPITVGG